MNTAPFYLMQKNINTVNGLRQNLVLCGNWDFENNKTVNTAVRFSNKIQFENLLKFQDQKTAKEYCDKVNAYGYRMQVTNAQNEWSLNINEFKS